MLFRIIVAIVCFALAIFIRFGILPPIPEPVLSSLVCVVTGIVILTVKDKK